MMSLQRDVKDVLRTLEKEFAIVASQKVNTKAEHWSHSSSVAALLP